MKEYTGSKVTTKKKRIELIFKIKRLSNGKYEVVTWNKNKNTGNYVSNVTASEVETYMKVVNEFYKKSYNVVNTSMLFIN